MCAYGHIYPYMNHFGARGVHETYSQCIHTQEASTHYIQLIQLWCSATQLKCKGL